jgi:transposase InsO family protein
MDVSNQGNQYRASLYQPVLAWRGVVASMSRKGNCYNNPPVESAFSSLMNELARHRQFRHQAEVQLAIAKDIEGFYNSQRLHHGHSMVCAAGAMGKYPVALQSNLRVICSLP